MSANWFYVRRWQRSRIEKIGKELNKDDATSLFKALSSFDDKVYLALVNKKDRWKVVQSLESVEDWKVKMKSYNKKIEDNLD